MKKYFEQLRPLERRLVAGVGVILFIVLNWVFVKPHYGDWSDLHGRLDDANRKLTLYRAAIAQKPALEKEVNTLQSNGGYVPQEDQAINFIRAIQSQAIDSGVAIVNTSRQITHTNDAFFVEQVQNINVSATDEQLVDFLYKLGSGASMIRVRDLELQPDTTRMRLMANIRLVASFQKSPDAKPAAADRKSAPVTPVTPDKRPGLAPMTRTTVKVK
jgi:type II secretory pathway component PulM